MHTNKRKPTVKDKLAAVKEGRDLPVDLMPHPSDIGRALDTDEKLVLDLARAYQHAEDPDYIAVSWANQERAMNYYNVYGFVDTLTELFRIEGEVQ